MQRGQQLPPKALCRPSCSNARCVLAPPRPRAALGGDGCYRPRSLTLNQFEHFLTMVSPAACGSTPTHLPARAATVHAPAPAGRAPAAIGPATRPFRTARGPARSPHSLLPPWNLTQPFPRRKKGVPRRVTVGTLQRRSRPIRFTDLAGPFDCQSLVGGEGGWTFLLGGGRAPH